MSGELKALRERAGLSMEALAKAAGTQRQQIHKLENGERKLTKEWAQRLAPHLGVSWAEVMGWEGVKTGDRFVPAPRAEPSASLDIRTVVIPEYDVAPQAGHGADMPELDGEGHHLVVAQWSMPSEYLRSYVADPSAVSVIRVAGDSMEPDYPAGERVMVDTNHRIPSPPGVYVLWDGFGMVLKRIEIIIGTTPPRVRISSINAEAYPPYERELSEVHINGRVIGKWMWR